MFAIPETPIRRRAPALLVRPWAAALRLLACALAIAGAAACASSTESTSDGGSRAELGPATDGAAPPDQAVASSSDASADLTDASGGGPNDPPTLVSCDPAAMAGQGLVITWTLSNPCDTIDVERQDQIHGFPSTQHPAQPPQFPGLPGASLRFADKQATDPGFQFFYRARCVVGGAASAWSNIVQHAGN